MYNDYLRFKYMEKFLINKYIKNKREKIKIFDAGSGEGNYSFFFAQNYKNITVDAYEIDQDLFQKTKNLKNKINLKNLNIYNELIEKNPKRNYYDFILLFGILDFNKDIQKILDKLYINLKKGGKLIIFSMSSKEEKYFQFKLYKEKGVKDGLRKNKGFTKLEITNKLKKYNIDFNYYLTNKLNLFYYLLFKKSFPIFRLLINNLLKILTFILFILKKREIDEGVHLMIIAKK